MGASESRWLEKPLRKRKRGDMSPINIEFKRFHQAQRDLYASRTGRDVWRCGRRFGKTTMLEESASNWAIKDKWSVGWFAPDYKLLLPSYKRILRRVAPLVASASKIDMIIELVTGGQIEFWTLNNEDAGRSRAYDMAIIDEAGLVKKGLGDIWEQAIEPTLVDRNGRAIVTGTPKGEDPDSWFYNICTQKHMGWHERHMPTHANPTLSQEALAKMEKTKAPLVWRQEFLAEFVNWAGVQFFELAKFLDEDGYPYPFPIHVDAVFAVMDTALKDGKENDGTAVTYFAVNKTFGKPRLFVLDWDIIQIKGNTLKTYLPTIVFPRLEELARVTKARMGTIGTWIEDTGAGTILIQHGMEHSWPVHAIDSALTGIGKDERALSVSGHIYEGDVGICEHAFNKTVEFKQQTKNHFNYQVFSFRIGDPEAYKRADDLLDTLTCGVSIALGNNEGY